ncbi:hypothetical protein H7J73_18585 [Mycolicibacterium komossense]|uniref:Lipoprotein n=1 Tax=Mycolicibacterium komossense TaxID=1779 RepID=A0ABT3CEW6_9MYCO|nr:hypothetical protein [Mycolicibacterium komossense]
MPLPPILVRARKSSGALIVGLAVLGVSACGRDTLIAGEATADPVSLAGVHSSLNGTGDVPVTLESATAAAQADIDRYSAGDFGFVWEHMTKDVREAMTKEDFVTYYRTCKSIGPKLVVTGTALADDRATVAIAGPHTTGYRVMAYQDGQWNMAPTDTFAKHLGQPVRQLIEEETRSGLCSH